MVKKKVEDFFFIVDELEETESELRETHFKITKMESNLKKETKEDKIDRLWNRIQNYNKNHEILNDISYDLFEELDDYCNHLAANILEVIEEEFMIKMFNHFVISKFVEKIDLIIEQLKKRSEELDDKKKRQMNERLQDLFIVRNCLNRKSDSCALLTMISNIKDYLMFYKGCRRLF